MAFSYQAQPSPGGIAQAFLLGEDFIDGNPVCLILGDNIFFGHDLMSVLVQSTSLELGAHIFAYRVQDPERFGVVEFDGNDRALSVEEKPKKPRSNWAVTGLYFYDNQAVEIAKSLEPSARGELEITDVNLRYLQAGQLMVTPLGRGVAWLDTGTHDSLLASSLFVQTLEQRQGLKIACIEEIALFKGFIDADQFLPLMKACANTNYGLYLKRIFQEHQDGMHRAKPDAFHRDA
jgi:glucose-1-phosphate thymidylyltransferase